MKYIFLIIFAFVIKFCSGQEPGWSGFKFRVYDKQNMPVTPTTQKEKKIKILFSPVDQYFQCPRKARNYISSAVIFDSTINRYSYKMWAAPSFPCKPSFIIVQGKDTMFLKMTEILGCMINNIDSKLDYCDPFIIRFKKGYFLRNEQKEEKEKPELSEYFSKEIAEYFCNWEEIKASK